MEQKTMNSDDQLARFDPEQFEADLAAAGAAETPEEKLMILERCMSHDDAVCWLERMLDPTLTGGCVHMEDAPDEAVTR
jgi:hypothetical protein